MFIIEQLTSLIFNSNTFINNLDLVLISIFHDTIIYRNDKCFVPMPFHINLKAVNTENTKSG